MSAYSPDYIARRLADSGCDITDEAVCIEALVAAGIKPDQISPDPNQRYADLIALRARAAAILRDERPDQTCNLGPGNACTFPRCGC